MKDKDTIMLEESYRKVYESLSGRYSDEQILNMLRNGQITSAMFDSDESFAEQVAGVYYQHNKQLWKRVIPRIAKELNRNPQELFNQINDAFLEGSYDVDSAIMEYEQGGEPILRDEDSVYRELKQGFESGLYEGLSTQNKISGSESDTFEVVWTLKSNVPCLVEDISHNPNTDTIDYIFSPAQQTNQQGMKKIRSDLYDIPSQIIGRYVLRVDINEDVNSVIYYVR